LVKQLLSGNQLSLFSVYGLILRESLSLRFSHAYDFRFRTQSSPTYRVYHLCLDVSNSISFALQTLAFLIIPFYPSTITIQPSSSSCAATTSVFAGLSRPKTPMIPARSNTMQRMTPSSTPTPPLPLLTSNAVRPQSGKRCCLQRRFSQQIWRWFYNHRSGVVFSRETHCWEAIRC
jgi:hypothetical protein